MTENSDKYRALHDFVTDPSKAELFGMGGLFGGLKENHAVLKLFATFVNKLKQKYNHIPNVINSKTFIEYINSEPTLDQGKKEALIKKIQYIYKKGVIQDEPIAGNTLYNFALVLDDLNIGEKKELILPQYERALEGTLQLTGKGQRVETKTSSEQTKPSEQIRPGESMDANKNNEAMPTGQAGVSNSVPGNGPEKQETDEEDKKLSVSEEDEEKDSMETKTANKNGASPSGQPAAVTIPETEQGEKQGPQTKQTLDRPGAGSPMDNGLNKPSLFEEKSEENPQIPQIKIRQPGEPIETETSEVEHIDTAGLSQLPFEERAQVPGVISGKQTIPTGGQGMPRQVIVSGKGLRKRKPMTQPERFKEPTAKESRPSKTKAETPETQPADQREVSPQRSTTEAGANIKDSGKKSSFGKKLAKLAGAGVGAGVILPLFAGGSAEAADFISLLF